MVVELEKDIKLPSGVSYGKGTKVSVAPVEKNPIMCIVSDMEGKPLFRIASKLLHRLNRTVFHTASLEEIMDEYLDRGVCLSVTGEEIEIDGVDSQGFVSLGRAYGFV